MIFVSAFLRLFYSWGPDVTCNYDETKLLIGLVLQAKRDLVSEQLFNALAGMKHDHPEFYDGVIKHSPGMPLTSDQWLDFLLKVPHWRLLEEKALIDKLSPHQRGILLGT